jgi:hypothetical protein
MSMSKKRAILFFGMSIILAGCGSEPAAPTPATPPVAASPTTKPVEKSVAIAAPAKPAPPPLAVMAPAPVWDAPVDGRPKFMTVRAEGVQIYQCKKTATGAFQWTLVAPEALLYNDKGRNIGKHGAGPFWQLSDGSKVVAAKIASKPQQGTIDWLLLKTESTSGSGALTKVKYIERIDTSGGTPPTLPADAAQEGKEERVPYRATYVFYAGS